MGFNYFIDAPCYYNCSEITPDRYSTNSYYRMAQNIKKNPEAEIVLVGSSRGGTTSPVWMSEVTGKKVLNLSAAGAAIFARSVFLEIAAQEMNLKKVYWLADFFELSGGLGDEKIVKSQALYKYIDPNSKPAFHLSDLQTLIDRSTLEASFHALGSPSKAPVQDGSDVDYKNCSRADYEGGVSALQLEREVDLLYESYTRRVFPQTQGPEARELLLKTLKHLQEKNIEVVIVIPPYHPEFRRRLKEQQPEVYAKHLAWIQSLKDLENPLLKVVNHFEGFPGETSTPKHWDDGVHFNCHSAIQMLAPLL